MLPAIPAVAWVVGAGTLGTGGAVALYVVADTPREVLRKNAIPLALIAAGTFIALKWIDKKG